MSAEFRPSAIRGNDPIPHAVTPGAVRAGSILSAILSVALCVEVVSMGMVGYYQVQDALEPENLADRVEEILRTNYPAVRERIVQEAHQEAPVIARQVSAEILKASPDARERLETLTARQLEVGLDRVAEVSEDQFRILLRNNRDRIEQAFIQIENAPEEARAIVLDAEASVEEQLGVNMREQARQALEFYRQFNDKLEYLSMEGVELTQQEKLERRMVRILRALGGETAEARSELSTVSIE